MATKAKHLSAIKAQRIDWSEADNLLADQLADVRAKLDKERRAATKAPATVPTAAGGEKSNPVFAVIERMAQQEARLTRRLGLGLRRTKGGQYERAKSPMEARQQLWERLVSMCVENLMPGLWRYAVRDAGVEIAEDSKGYPNNPKALAEAGKDHEVGTYYPLRND